MAEHHWLFHDKVTDATLDPVVHVGSADSGPSWPYDHIMRGRQRGDGPVFVEDFAWSLEHKGRILCGVGSAKDFFFAYARKRDGMQLIVELPLESSFTQTSSIASCRTRCGTGREGEARSYDGGVVEWGSFRYLLCCCLCRHGGGSLLFFLLLFFWLLGVILFLRV